MNVNKGAGVIDACCVTPFVRAWLTRSLAVRVLHVFDRACNLVNDQGEIVSLVTAARGPGPFAIVLPSAAAPIFSQLMTRATPVAINGSVIKLGALVVDTAPAVEWSPRPAWEALRRQGGLPVAYLPILTTLMGSSHPANNDITIAYRRHFAAGTERLISGLAAGNADACRQGAQQLAGLGPGLTPAGDDFLVGATYGLWATRPAEQVQYWGNVIAETAAPRTTLLSAAWLRVAARGEAGDAWHELMWASGQWVLQGLRTGSGSFEDSGRAVGSEQYGSQEIAVAVERILNTGHTSGADALAGFIAVLELGI